MITDKDRCPCGEKAGYSCRRCKRQLCVWHVAGEPSTAGESITKCHPICEAPWWVELPKRMVP